MAYKIENGKVYEIREVNVSEIEKEIKQAIEFIKQYESKQQPYLSAIAKKKDELNAIVARYNNEIASYQKFVDESAAEIEKAKATLTDKKEIIAQLFPNYNSVLGF